MKTTLDQKIKAGFIFAAVILAVVAVLSFRNNKKFRDASEIVRHTQEVLYEFEQVMIACVDAETGERGYIITGDESYLDPYNSAKVKLTQHLSRVRALTVDNPEQQRNIPLIEKKIDDFIERLEYCIEERRNQGFDKVQKSVMTDIGKSIMDEIRIMIDDAKKIENDLLVVRKKMSEDDASDFNTIFTLLLVVIMIVLISVFVIITFNLRALKKAEQETADKNWTLTGSSELVKNMQGNLQVGELSEAVINHLTRYLNAQVGAMYVVEDRTNELMLSGSFSLSRTKQEPVGIKFGEGLVSQAAADNKLISIAEVPDKNFELVSSFGNVKPREVIAVPFSYESAVTGVFELGTIHKFTNLQKQYMELVAGSIAIAVISSKARKQVKDLLEETQVQAEELEAQQEELKQANEELHTKTELLEDSETELKAQQKDLERINVELENKAQVLEEQKNKMEDAKKEIENKAREVEEISKYKSEFLANMSHELRTPLNSILILSQLLSENKQGKLGTKEIEFSKNINTSGNDLLNLINEILDLSKIESGKMELDIAQVQLKDIVNDVAHMFTELAKNKSVDFRINFTGNAEQAVMTTDKQRVEQIVKNLLSNAFKFTPKDGSVTLTVGEAPPGKTFYSRNLSGVRGLIAFSVSDTGIGIPQSKQAIIFEAFQQADGSTKRKYGGTGLGLSISRELANVLGGEIQLESSEGKGSTFTLYLPLRFDVSLIVSGKQVEVRESRAEAPPVKIDVIAERHADPVSVAPVIAANDDRDTIQEKDKVVLIIEDDPIFAATLLDFVRTRNYKGVIAYQGNTGLSFARHYKPDAIMLDIQLPVMDGVEVLRQVKNDPDLRHIPVQIISGHARKKEGFELGAFDYLQKPITTGAMQKAFDKVENFINKKPKKLLIVEDNTLQNEAIKELIGNGDVKCFSAYRGNEAYTMLQKDDYDCIIVDLNLPDMSGFELLDKIKSNDKLNVIPVVVYTGKDLTREEKSRLAGISNTVILKTADSHERLLDETVLFLHKVESKLPEEKQNLLRKLHKTDEVLKDKKILIVDDDMRNIYSLLNVLEDEGIQCVIAENGKVALEQMEKHPDLDLVLMDIMMPEMDGYEATVEIRKKEAFAKIPIIALTAKAMKGDKEKCLAVGMSDYISKPVNITQLLSLIRVWVYK